VSVRTVVPGTGAAQMSVRSAAAWALTSQYAAFAIQFATSVLLARLFISPAELGLFSIAFAAVSLVSFLQDFGVTRYVNGERDLTADKLATAYTVSVAFAWTVALLALFASGPIASFYGDPRLLPIARIIAASYLMVPLSIVPQATCQRRMDYKSNTLIELGSSIANAAVAIVLAMRGHGAAALAWGAFAQQAARLVVSQWRAARIEGRLLLPWPLRLSGARPVLEIGATNSVLSTCYSLNARLPELVIGRLISNAGVGLFARASGLAIQLRLLVAGAVTGVFYPAFRQVRDSGQPLGPPFLRVVGAYTGVTWAAMAGIAVLATPLIEILYGPRWLEAAPLLKWIALSQLCYVAVPLAYDLPLLLDRKTGLIRRNLIETAISVLLIAIAAPFGLGWVAISRFVHGLIWIAIYAPFMRAMLDFSWRDLMRVWAKSLAATLAAIAPLLASYVLVHPPAEAGLLQLGLATLAGVILWFAVLALTRHPLLAEITGMLRTLRSAAIRPRPVTASR
jgi:O-antigen/teichoic acid export membrane protein